MSASMMQNPEDYVFAPVTVPADPVTAEFYQKLCRGMGHKMNNHLSVVHGYSSLLLMDEHVPERVADPAKAICGASRQMQRLISDLQVLAGCAKLQCELVRLNDWFAEHERAVRDRAAAAQVPFTLSVARDLPAIRTDPSRLRDMIFHLLDNALQAAAGHHGQVAIDALPPGVASSPESPGIDILFRNSGKVMPHEQIPRYLQPFETTKNNGEHAGLGLPVAATLARSCGGFLGLRTYGTTTTAWLHLKVAED